MSGLEDFAEGIKLQSNEHTCDLNDLKTLLPFGRIALPTTTQTGWYRQEDKNGTGEPIIAVSHAAELLANLCMDAPARSKLVVANGLDHFRSIQAYDDISQTQRLVIFADCYDEEMIKLVASRGCKFWPIGRRELISANSATEKNTKTGFIGSVVRWAESHESFSINDIACEDTRLDAIWSKLDKLRAGTVPAEADNTLAKLISRAWRLFLNATYVWETPREAERMNAQKEIDRFRLDAAQSQMWISSESVRTMNEIADDLTTCYGPDSTLGTSKGTALLNAIQDASLGSKTLAVLVRNEAKVSELCRWLLEHDQLKFVRVFSPVTLPSNDAFDRVLCVSWLGGETMRQIAAKLVAPCIAVTGYRCERQWLRQCEWRFRTNIPTPTFTTNEKSEFISGGKLPRVIWPEERQQTLTPVLSDRSSDIWDFEHQLRIGRIGLATRPTQATETLPARFVRFSGEYYAFLTETHKLPVATELVSNPGRGGQTLPEKSLIDIKLGDFVVFPESGERELIQELADRLIGVPAQELRKRAHQWKDTLRLNRITPEEFLRHAKELNRSRHPVTIRNWYSDTYQIGPREKDDLVLIAIVTEDENFEKQIDGVWSAIEQLRSAHLSAGLRLRDALLQRLPQVTSQIEDSGTQVDLGELGSARILRVESIDSATEPRGRAEVNRLHLEKFGPELGELLKFVS